MPYLKWRLFFGCDDSGFPYIGRFCSLFTSDRYCLKNGEIPCWALKKTPKMQVENKTPIKFTQPKWPTIIWVLYYSFFIRWSENDLSQGYISFLYGKCRSIFYRANLQMYGFKNMVHRANLHEHLDRHFLGLLSVWRRPKKFTPKSLEGKRGTFSPKTNVLLKHPNTVEVLSKNMLWAVSAWKHWRMIRRSSWRLGSITDEISESYESFEECVVGEFVRNSKSSRQQKG